MKSLIVILGLAFASVASADVPYQIDVSKLTQEQRAAIQLQVTQVAAKTADPVNLSETVRNEASKWGDLGKNVGTSLVAAAKEVGQGVNEFSQTPVGKVTTAIIVYKVIGHDVIHLVVGLLTLVVGTLVALYVFRRMGVEMTYENIPRLNGLWISRKIKSRSVDGDYYVGGIVVPLIILALTWTVGLNTLL